MLMQEASGRIFFGRHVSNRIKIVYRNPDVEKRKKKKLRRQ